MIYQILFTLLILACMAGLSLLYEMRTTKEVHYFTFREYIYINFLIQVLIFSIGVGIYQLIQA